jgi:hypothetical protein
MNVITAFSTKNTIEEITQDIKQQIGDFDTKMLLFFASSKFDPSLTAKEMHNTFENASVFGCTTAGEITTGQMLKNSVAVMAFNSEIIGDVKIEVLENLDEYPSNINKAFGGFEKHFGQPVQEMDFQEYVGIILIDGLSGTEEKIMDKIGDLTNVVFVGGSAGDDLKFENTYVYANGKAYTNAALLTLMKPSVNFSFIKTESFCPLSNTLIATKVNEAERTVVEFNNKPAVQAYAEALNVPVEEASNRFMHNPIGLMMDEIEPYVRSPQQIKGDNLVFYCNILEGMELSLLESGNIIADTKKAIEDKQEMGSISALINFHCILRTLELEQKGLMTEYGKIFSDIPTIGFSTYGEEYIGHINQTSTMLAFQ